MSTKDEIREQIESDMIAEALAAYMEASGNEMIQECAAQSEYALPVKTHRRFARTVRRELAAQRPRFHQTRRILLASAVLLALTIGASAVALHEAFFNFVIEQHEKYLTAGGAAHAYLSMDGLYSPSYRPEGYQLSGNPQQHHGLVYLTYRQSEGNGTISFQQSVTGTGRVLDTEKAKSVERIFIGDSPGTLVVREDGSCQMLWRDGTFLLSATKADGAELVRMAESVVLIGDEPVK